MLYSIELYVAFAHFLLRGIVYWSCVTLSHWDPYAMHRGGCLELYYCNMVEWRWWDSSLIWKISWFPSVLWHCWFGNMTCKNRPWNDLKCVEWDGKPLHYTVSPKKTKPICFCQNFVKFPQISIICGRKMGNDPDICEVHSFSTSPNLRHHLTVLNANVPNCYITLNVVIYNKLLTT